MRKTFATIWAILSAILSLVLTLLSWGPVGQLREWLGNGIIMTFLLVCLMLLLPVLIVFAILNAIHNRKGKMPADLSGKTGIVIKREKELSGGALMYDVRVNGTSSKKLGMGKKTFIELEPGEYTLQTWMGKAHSPELTVHLEPGKIAGFSTKVDFNKSMVSLTLKGEMLLLTPYPLQAL